MTRYFKQPVLALKGIGTISARDHSKVAMQVVESWENPVAPTANYILTTTALPAGSAAHTTVAAASLAHQPDYPRNLTAVADVATTSKIVATGVDQFGDDVSEELTLNGSTTVTGSKIFASITSLELQDRTGSACNVVVGVGAKMGVTGRLLNFAVEVLVDGSLDTNISASDTTNESITFYTAPDGSKDFVAKYWSSSVR